jgi:16S rRNA (guanine527-N7)-methyltransferase
MAMSNQVDHIKKKQEKDDWHTLIRQMSPGLDGQVVERLCHYVTRLEAWNRVHNLTGLDSAHDIVTQLVMPSIALQSTLSKYACVLDLGTGAGIPGVVLAICQPCQQWVLVERSKKKVLFLKHIINDFALKNIKIIAEDFTSISVDPNIGAIVSRGSAKLEQQIKMTHHWREQGSKLYSIQTAKSLAEQAESLTSIQSTQLAIDGDLELVLLQVL